MTLRTTTCRSAFVAVVAVVIAISGAAGCSGPVPPPNSKSVEDEIRRLNTDWIAAEASNNVESALAFIWDDATMQPPNGAEMQGHAAIRAAYESVRFISLTSGPTTVSVGASADVAAIWGPLKVVIDGPNGPITLDQKFVAVWQKRNGVWKVVENSWNDNNPKAGS